MSTLIEEALNLSKEEKIKLYYALQEDLGYDDNILAEEELTSEQWTELDKRTKDAESGTSVSLLLEEFKKQMNENVDAIRSNNR